MHIGSAFEKRLSGICEAGTRDIAVIGVKTLATLPIYRFLSE